MQIVAATQSKHKILELQSVAKEFGVEVISPASLLGELGDYPNIEETGATFGENALIKAQSCCSWSGRPSLGDDSGLEVDALGGAPGIYSARYGGAGASDEYKNQKLLRELAAIEQSRNIGNSDSDAFRSARFRCALVLQFPDGRQFGAEAALEGTILNAPRGDRGFGYDPIVHIPSIGATLAEIDFEITCQKGFRGVALRKLMSALQVAGVLR